MRSQKILFTALAFCLLTGCASTTKTEYVPAKTKAPASCKVKGEDPVVLPENTDMGILLDAASTNADRLDELNIRHNACIAFILETGQ